VDCPPVNVLSRKRRIPCPRDVVDPVVSSKSDRVADGEVNAGVPVDDEQNEEHHLGKENNEWWTSFSEIPRKPYQSTWPLQ